MSNRLPKYCWQKWVKIQLSSSRQWAIGMDTLTSSHLGHLSWATAWPWSARLLIPTNDTPASRPAHFWSIHPSAEYNTVLCCVCQVAGVISDSLRPRGLQLASLFCPWNSPGKNTGVGCHFLLQGVFLIWGSNPHLLYLLHWQASSLTTSIIKTCYKWGKKKTWNLRLEYGCHP